MFRHLFQILIIVTLSVPVIAAESFLPQNFDVPEQLETDNFRIRVLTVNDVVKDYDAVMSSLEHLQGQFLEEWGWPRDDLSLEQDLIDLGWHQKEFQMRSSFAYTVVTLDESRVIGCVYIFPFGKGGYDAEATMWVRSDMLESGLDKDIYKTVRSWIAEDWPFERTAYPGREMSWEEFNRLSASD